MIKYNDEDNFYGHTTCEPVLSFHYKRDVDYDPNVPVITNKEFQWQATVKIVYREQYDYQDTEDYVKGIGRTPELAYKNLHEKLITYFKKASWEV